MKKLIVCAMFTGVLLPAYAATAIWTGRMTQVQTVTHQVAWNCEYNINGQRFWRTFATSCPSSVEVQ